MFLDWDITYLLEVSITQQDDSLFVYLETVKFVLKLTLVPQILSDFGRSGLIR